MKATSLLINVHGQIDDQFDKLLNHDEHPRLLMDFIMERILVYSIRMF